MTSESNSPSDSSEQKLVEGEDFYFDDDHNLVFTADYLKKRGHCCKSGCRHCPYGFTQTANPDVPAELQDPWSTP